jgi:hypothetical protein
MPVSETTQFRSLSLASELTLITEVAADATGAHSVESAAKKNTVPRKDAVVEAIAFTAISRSVAHS